MSEHGRERLRRLGAIAAMSIAAAAALPATSGAADWPRRLFTVAKTTDPQFDAVQDFLERPGGAIVIASGSDDSFRAAASARSASAARSRRARTTSA